VDSEPPEIVPSGDGKQKQPPAESLEIPLSTHPHLLTSHLAGIVTDFPTAFGNRVSGRLFSGIYAQLSDDYNERKVEVRELRAELKNLQIALAAAEKDGAVKQAQIENLSRARTFNTIGSGLATLFMSLGVKLIYGSESTTGWIVFLGGTVLLIFSWFYTPKKSSQ